MGHSHKHTHPVETGERYHIAQRCTWVSVGINVLLSVTQIIIGYFGHSQALIADGFHSLSDLVSDFLTLFANKHGRKSADDRHPYGHARIETATTLILGMGLIALGFVLLAGAINKFYQGGPVEKVHPATLWTAVFTLVCKEILFRYIRAVAKRINSQILMANAWHSRSDAASSLIVVVGISGNLLGFTHLDLFAAVIVVLFIIQMGWTFSAQAIRELIDTSLDQHTLAAIRETLTRTPGVRGLHSLRTRQMAGKALVDAHILVDPKISVSEGHHIAEMARHNVLAQHDVLDVLMHVDIEDDTAEVTRELPDRTELTQYLENCLADICPNLQRITLHYLKGKVEAEVFLRQDAHYTGDAVNLLNRRIKEKMLNDPYFCEVSVYLESPQDSAE